MKVKLLIIIFISTTLYKCSSGNSDQNNIQKDLFGRKINYDNVSRIEILEINHPMLGGVLSRRILNENEKLEFIKKIKTVEYNGVYKCASQFVIKLIIGSDTFRLKTCGEKISDRNNDIYYSLPNEGVFISNYLKPL